MTKKSLLGIPAIALVLAVLAGCASMIVVSIDNESVTGPKRVRQYGAIDPKDVTVYANYKDGSRKPVSLSNANITFDSSKVGPQTVNLKVSGYPASFQTEVMALTRITVAAQPNYWKLGVLARSLSSHNNSMPVERNNWPGLEIQGAWDQMGSEKISADAIADECQFSGFDPNKAGRQNVTVTWNGKQTSFNVQVVAMDSIKITALPTKTTYYQGEPFVLTGLKIAGVWPGLPEEQLPVNPDDVTGFNTQNKGRQTLTVTRNGKSATFSVEVLDILGILNGTWDYITRSYNPHPMEYTFNNGAFVWKYESAVVDEAGNALWIEIKGTYAIAPGYGKTTLPDTGVRSIGPWFGEVTFTAANPAQQNLLDKWPAFSIGTDTSNVGEVMKGTILSTEMRGTKIFLKKR